MNANNIYLPSDNLHSMIIKSIIWGIIGSALGISINNIYIYILNHIDYKPNITLEILLQFILCCILLSVIHINFNYFGWTWQTTTPGLIFVCLFFGVQYNIFNNIQQIFIIDKKNK